MKHLDECHTCSEFPKIRKYSRSTTFKMFVVPFLIWALIILVFANFVLSQMHNAGFTDYTSILYNASNTLMPFIAVGAILLAREQLIEANNQSKFTSLGNSINILLQIKNQFNSPEVNLAQRKIANFSKKIIELNPSVDRSEISDNMENHFTEYMKNIYATDDYMEIIKLLNYLENIGFLIKKEFANIDDIDTLFGSLIVSYWELFRGHVCFLREKHKSTTIYENSENLYKELTELRKLKAQEQAR